MLSAIKTNILQMKIIKFLPFFVLILFYNCNPNSSKISKEQYIEQTQKKEFEKSDELYENAGKVIGEIQFNLKATEEQKKDWEDGIIPWISLENTSSQINQLINADEIVIKEKLVNIIIDYPLNKPTNFEIESKNGFSRKNLILAISKKYHEIYAEEEKTAKTKTTPIDKRTGIINRNETDGKYGIWGHDLGDLDLSGIEIHQGNDGKINLILWIES